jgi:hypothetical protein
LSSTYFDETTPLIFPGLALPPIVISPNLSRSVTEPTGVVGLLLCCSFFLASIVALASHRDSIPVTSTASLSTVISGKSSGTLAELASLLLKCKRWDSLLCPVFEFDLSLLREETDAPDAVEVVRGRPLNNPLLFRVPQLEFLNEGGGLEDSVEEKVGGDMISCVCVSLRMKVNWNSGSSGMGGGGGTTRSFSTFSFFLSISLKGIVY